MNMTEMQHLDLLFRFDRGLAIKEIIFNNIKKGMTVLDAGCGSGILSVLAVKAGADIVYAVDQHNISLAKVVAEQNQCEKKIKFIEADLLNLKQLPLPKFDFILAMLYFNDPRRDKMQANTAMKTIRQYLKKDGKCLPDKILYNASGFDWPAQDFPTKKHLLEKKIEIIEGKYRVKLPFYKNCFFSVDPKWFPERKANGFLEKENAKVLTLETFFANIDFYQNNIFYPEKLDLKIIQPGCLNSIVFTQHICFGDTIIFSNESISWLENPVNVSPGKKISISFDKQWLKTNLATVISKTKGGIGDAH